MFVKMIDQCHSPGEIPGHVCNRHDDYSVQEFTPTAISVQAKLQLLPNISRIPAAWWIHSLAQLHSYFHLYATYLHYITLIHCQPKTYVCIRAGGRCGTHGPEKTFTITPTSLCWHQSRAAKQNLLCSHVCIRDCVGNMGLKKESQ